MSVTCMESTHIWRFGQFASIWYNFITVNNAVLGFLHTSWAKKKTFMFRIQGSILVIYWNAKLFIQLSKSILAWRLKWDLVIKSCDFFWNNVSTRWLYKIHFVQAVMIVQKYHTAKQLHVLFLLWNWILSTCLDHSWLLFLFTYLIIIFDYYVLFLIWFIGRLKLIMVLLRF